MRKLKLRRPLSLAFVLLFWATACRPTTAEPTAELIIPTAIVPTQAAVPDAAELPAATAELPAAPTFQPGDGLSNQPGEQTTPEPPSTPQFQVAFVAPDDTLNVRSGPGVDFDVVGELAPNTSGVEISGTGQVVSDSTWVLIQGSGLTGWVNSRFLVETNDKAAFCQDDTVEELLADLNTAVADQDGALLAGLVHPERGLRIHQTWWNPEIQLTKDQVRDIFSSNTSIDWGVQDGSGDPIVGTFSEKILPLLQEDLLQSEETACDEIIHGGTAGLVRLPDGYEAVHYYSLYRSGTEEFAGMNWGTWVVGIERWEGSYYISFLLHFNWEI